MAAEYLPGGGDVLFHRVGNVAHVALRHKFPCGLLELLGPFRYGVDDLLAKLLRRIQQGVGCFGIGHPLLHPAVEGVRLQVQLCHGLAGGDFTIFPTLQDGIEHLIVHFDGLTALAPAVLFDSGLRLLFLPGPGIQLGHLSQNIQREAALLRAGVEILFHTAEANPPGLQVLQQL